MEQKRKPGRPQKVGRTLPNRLREFREAANISLGDMAAIVGVSTPALCKAELVRSSSVSKETWFKIADVLRVDPRILSGHSSAWIDAQANPRVPTIHTEGGNIY
jgi:transcriptional regulator with XRE-family HTH domain